MEISVLQVGLLEVRIDSAWGISVLCALGLKERKVFAGGR